MDEHELNNTEVMPILYFSTMFVECVTSNAKNTKKSCASVFDGTKDVTSDGPSDSTVRTNTVRRYIFAAS